MKLFLRLVCLSFGVVLLSPTIVSSQQIGALKMSVYPKEAYTFVDGKAVGPGNRKFNLPYGSHQVIVANYGYKFYEKEVTIDSERAAVLKVTLDPIGEEVSGPRGRIQLELGELSTFTDAGADAGEPPADGGPGGGPDATTNDAAAEAGTASSCSSTDTRSIAAQRATHSSSIPPTFPTGPRNCAWSASNRRSTA